MNDIISVIIPVYNVHKYLPKCLESIISQTYKDLEIIIVDDGSMDDSRKICEQYAASDDRIRLIHKENGGAASARNVGLSIATGEYLAFVDSDDFLEIDAYEFMIKKLKKSNADVIQCCLRNVYKDYHKDIIQMEKEYDFAVEEYLKRFTVDWTCGLATDKLFRRELFDGIYYAEGHKIDDEFFTYRGILNAKKIIYYPKIVYNYRQRSSSVMLSKSSGKKIVFDKLEYLKIRRKDIIERFSDLANVFDNHYANMLISMLKEPYLTEESLQKTKEQIKEFLLEEKKIEIGLKMKLQLIRVLWIKNKKLLDTKLEMHNPQETKDYFE